MSLVISHNCASFSIYGNDRLLRYGGQKGEQTVREREKIVDELQLSGNGRLAVSGLQEGLILPTEENLIRLSASLSQDLGSLLAALGISTSPPIEFDLGSSGEIRINGNRADKELVLQAVNGNEKVKEGIRTTAAIASHAAAMADSLQFQKEYMASSHPEGVVHKYSYLFGPAQRSHQVSLTYNGSSVNLLLDGKAWL